MKTITRELTAGGVASAGFLGALFALSLPIVVAIPAGVILYFGVRMAIPRCLDDDEITVSPGMTLEQAKKLLADGYVQANKFREVAKSIKDKEIRNKIEEMAQVITDLFKNFEEEPENLITVHGFMTDHLNRAYEIVSNYARLSNKPHLDAATSAKMARIVNTIDEISRAIKDQYLQIINNELTELDTAGKVFKKILDIEGPGSNELDLT